MTRDRAEARLLSRILRIGLLLALLGQIAWSFRPEPSRAQTDQQAQGQALYEANCSTCHGLQGEGTANGPSPAERGPGGGRLHAQHRQDAAGEPRRPARARRAEVHARPDRRDRGLRGRRSRPAASRSRPSTRPPATSRAGPRCSSTPAPAVTARGPRATRWAAGRSRPTINPADPDADRRGDPDRARA